VCLSVVTNALSPSMAKPLSKRQRTEVRKIVQQEISPEWKCKQGHFAPFNVDVSNAGQGVSLFAPIAQGLGPDDRVGRKIKVHRVDIWFAVDAPRQPQLPGPIPFVDQLYRRTSSFGPTPVNCVDQFDLTLYPHALWGPAPKFIGDKYAGNIKFRKFRRTWLAGLNLMTTSMWDRATPGIYVNSTAEAGFATTGVAQTFPAHNHYPAVDVQRSDVKGKAQHYGKRAIRFPNGLNVGYFDAALPGSGDENFVFWNYGFAAPPASPATHCAELELSYRVWFTDA